jgi:hypothetical protein
MQETQREMNCSGKSQMAALNNDAVIQSLQTKQEEK